MVCATPRYAIPRGLIYVSRFPVMVASAVGGHLARTETAQQRDRNLRASHARELLPFQQQVFARGASSRFVNIHELSLGDRPDRRVARRRRETRPGDVARAKGTGRPPPRWEREVGGRSLRLCEVDGEDARVVLGTRTTRSSSVLEESVGVIVVPRRALLARQRGRGYGSAAASAVRSAGRK